MDRSILLLYPWREPHILNGLSILFDSNFQLLFGSGGPRPALVASGLLADDSSLRALIVDSPVVLLVVLVRAHLKAQVRLLLHALAMSRSEEAPALDGTEVMLVLRPDDAFYNQLFLNRSLLSNRLLAIDGRFWLQSRGRVSNRLIALWDRITKHDSRSHLS